jgi:hypothetical protein
MPRNAPSLRCEATIDEEFTPGDELGLAGSKIDDRVGHIVRLGEVANGGCSISNPFRAKLGSLSWALTKALTIGVSMSPE